MKTIDINECHAILLDLAKELHRLCVKHNIPCIMIGGTMLGAIRHKGFIPWDDDMDFGIPRKYLKKFISVAEKELNPIYRLKSRFNSNLIYLDVLKLEDSRTIIEEKHNELATGKIGINIDIFPLDYGNGSHSFFSRNSFIFNMIRLVTFEYSNDSNIPFPKNLLVRLAKILRLVSPDFLSNYVEKNNKRYDNGNFLTNYYGLYKFKEIVPKELWGTPRLYKFENTEFLGAENYDAYLTHFYKNYMELPPENKRHTHLENAYWKE